MSEIRELHKQAVKYMHKANKAMINGDTKTHYFCMMEAMLKEKRAADLLKYRKDCEPTRSVLYRSAASMCIQLGEKELSIELATEGLNGDPFDEIKEELQTIINSW